SIQQVDSIYSGPVRPSGPATAAEPAPPLPRATRGSRHAQPGFHRHEYLEPTRRPGRIARSEFGGGRPGPFHEWRSSPGTSPRLVLPLEPIRRRAARRVPRPASFLFRFALGLPLLLPWQLPHELHGPLNPVLQLLVVLDASRLDRHPIPHRPAGDIERPNVQ